MGGWGQVKFNTFKKREGAKNVLAMLKGGGGGGAQKVLR